MWSSLQSRVKKQHDQKRTDVHALAESVMNTWNNDKNLSDDVINRVRKRLRNVLALIVEGDGGNDLVETKRGKEIRNLEISPQFLANNYVAIALVAEAAPTVAAAVVVAAVATDSYYVHSLKK